jgi:hypothetical protein
MTTLSEANAQWRSRPADERYDSVAALHATASKQRAESATGIMPMRNPLVGAYNDTRAELAAIEARGYADPLDYTRAAIARASIRSIEIDIVNDLAHRRQRERTP